MKNDAMKNALAGENERPLMLAPAFKDYIWGGERLKRDWGKQTDLSPLAEKSGVTLSQTGDDLWITGSDVLVYRAIFNLVENGVKYNHPGGSVCVAASRRGEEAMIEIKDTGCGIPEDFRESVFQPFFRVDKSRSREKGGVGLGLSLVWEIARLHGGGVRVRESGESGTVIELTLPILAEERKMP